jgi:hypothetical protein
MIIIKKYNDKIIDRLGCSVEIYESGNQIPDTWKWKQFSQDIVLEEFAHPIPLSIIWNPTVSTSNSN